MMRLPQQRLACFLLLLLFFCLPPSPFLSSRNPPTHDHIFLRSHRSCRLYDEHGFVLETSMHLEDIVMSDYFQIDDRCVVQPGRQGSVRVDVEVEVTD